MSLRYAMIPHRIVLWGAVGQARLIGEVIKQRGSEIAAVVEENEAFPSPYPDLPLFRNWTQFEEWLKAQEISDLGFSLGLNSNGQGRLELHEKLVNLGMQPVTLVHPSAIIASDAEIGEGSQIMAGVIVGPKATIGRQCIVNTKASVDHDNVIEDGAEISPGATLCGMVKVGSCAWIAAGATVLPLVQIGANAIVGAGAVVNKNVPENITVVGVPARPLG